MIKAANIIKDHVDPESPADSQLAASQLDQLRPEHRYQEAGEKIETTTYFLAEIEYTFFEIVLQVRHGSEEQIRLFELLQTLLHVSPGAFGYLVGSIRWFWQCKHFDSPWYQIYQSDNLLQPQKHASTLLRNGQNGSTSTRSSRGFSRLA
jgi:hypothetical protein